MSGASLYKYFSYYSPIFGLGVVHLQYAAFVLSQIAENESKAGLTSRNIGTELSGDGSQP